MEKLIKLTENGDLDLPSSKNSLKDGAISVRINSYQQFVVAIHTTTTTTTTKQPHTVKMNNISRDSVSSIHYYFYPRGPILRNTSCQMSPLNLPIELFCFFFCLKKLDNKKIKKVKSSKKITFILTFFF